MLTVAMVQTFIGDLICHHIAEMLLPPSDEGREGWHERLADVGQNDIKDVTESIRMPVNQHFDLMAGEVANGFVGERFSK